MKLSYVGEKNPTYILFNYNGFVSTIRPCRNVIIRLNVNDEAVSFTRVSTRFKPIPFTVSIIIKYEDINNVQPNIRLSCGIAFDILKSNVIWSVLG